MGSLFQIVPHMLKIVFNDWMFVWCRPAERISEEKPVAKRANIGSGSTAGNYMDGFAAELKPYDIYIYVC